MHHALLSGPELVSAAANLQPDAFACCQSCLQHPDNCTAWVYCPLQGGCHAPTTNATLTAVAGDSLLQLWEPYQGCRLLSPQAFALQSNSPQIIARGIEVPHVAGEFLSFQKKEQEVAGQLPTAGADHTPGTAQHLSRW